MAVKLHPAGLRQAKDLIAQGRAVRDERDDWSEHQPTAEEENAFIRRHGYAEYGRWHLGIDAARAEDTKARYKFPYGDFRRVHRCAVISAESRAGRNKYLDIDRAAHELHELMDAGAVRPPSRTPARTRRAPRGSAPRPSRSARDR
jgi:hypothetical protein